MRAFAAFLVAYDNRIRSHTTGDIIAMSPQLNDKRPKINQLIGTLRDVLEALPRPAPPASQPC